MKEGEIINRKFFILLVSLLFIIALSGCKNNKLSEEINEYIKNIYIEEHNSNGLKTLTTSDVNILYYFGKYGDSYVAIIEGDQIQAAIYDGAIGEFEFIYKPWEISVYNGGKYYRLKDAYTLNLINNEQLEDIYYQHEDYKQI